MKANPVPGETLQFAFWYPRAMACCSLTANHLIWKYVNNWEVEPPLNLLLAPPAFEGLIIGRAAECPMRAHMQPILYFASCMSHCTASCALWYVSLLKKKVIYLFYRWRDKCVIFHVTEPLLKIPMVKKNAQRLWWRLGMGWDVQVVGVGINPHAADGKSERLKA